MHDNDPADPAPTDRGSARFGRRPDSRRVAPIHAWLCAATPEVLRALDDAALPIRTAEPGDDHDDLRPLLPYLATCRIVALGDATHGPREFFQIKHSLVQVPDEAGLRTFAIETDRIAPVAWMPGAARGRGCRNGAPRSRVLDVEDRRSARARALVTGLERLAPLRGVRPALPVP